MEWYKMFNASCFIAVFWCMHSLGYSMLSICAALIALLAIELDDAFRNPIQKCHYIRWFIPVDAYKINSIVADFRKVLAENPQVKQERVLLEDFHPEDEDVKILISCFVETSHFEEYLAVKEAILFGLLEVMNHHQPPKKNHRQPELQPLHLVETLKDKSQSNSDSQSVVYETSPITSHEFGRGETAATSQSKQEEEKSLVF